MTAELAVGQLQGKETGTPQAPEESAALEKETEALLIGKQLELRAQRGMPMQPDTSRATSTHSCTAEVVRVKPSTKVLKRAAIDLTSPTDTEAQKSCDEWALHEFADMLEDGGASSEGRYCFRSLRRADRKVVVSGAIRSGG